MSGCWHSTLDNDIVDEVVVTNFLFYTPNSNTSVLKNKNLFKKHYFVHLIPEIPTEIVHLTKRNTNVEFIDWLAGIKKKSSHQNASSKCLWGTI